MESILILIPKPKKNAHGDIPRWEKCVANLKDMVEDSPESELIGEGSVLIRGENALGIFGSIVALVHKENLGYEVLFVEKATVWKCKAD